MERVPIPVESDEELFDIAEDIGFDSFQETLEDVSMAVEVARQKPVGVRNAYILVRKINSLICFLADEDDQLYEDYRHRLWVSDDGYEILKCEESPRKGSVEIDTDVRKIHD